ncbi:MAG: AraC family transcriptional regulator [Bacteroidetes bacterium]|nr:AraC family transcriptional regulator [Bacteroidota bacterium]
MKVLPFTITKTTKDAIHVQEDKQPIFYGALHQHEEFQISYILQGEGSLLVGDRVSPFEQGSIVILGANLPHVFKSFRGEGDSQMLSIFFTKDSFGTGFFDTEELRSLASIFSKAANGFIINKPSEAILFIFKKIQKASKLDRFLSFIQLLRLLNGAPHLSLSSFISEKKYTDIEGRRMNAVMQYTMNHFKEGISLTTIAREAAMTPQAFCNYFKKRTRKTYIAFVTELKIEESVKLLQKESELSIAEIAELSGFQNISHFNRKFKFLKGMSPLQFRKKSSL